MNLLGQLGNGGKTDSTVPVPVSGLSKGVTALSSDVEQTCALTDGKVFCWGDQIPDLIIEKNKEKVSASPKRLRSLTGVKLIALNNHHACVMLGINRSAAGARTPRAN